MINFIICKGSIILMLAFSDKVGNVKEKVFPFLALVVIPIDSIFVCFCFVFLYRRGSAIISWSSTHVLWNYWGTFYAGGCPMLLFVAVAGTHWQSQLCLDDDGHPPPPLPSTWSQYSRKFVGRKLNSSNCCRGYKYKKSVFLYFTLGVP